MSKAVQAIPMPTSGVNRRGLLRCAGGIAAASALSALPLAPAAAGFSPEFLEYRGLAIEHERLCAIPDPEFGSAAGLDALCDEACHARFAARQAWLDRKPTLTELAWAERAELWNLVDGKWEKHSDNDELEEALQLAVFAVLLEGGANV